MVILTGTKAETLERLAGALTTAHDLPQVRFSVGDWRTAPDAVLERLQAWAHQSVAVRSSAQGEDGCSGSQAKR